MLYALLVLFLIDAAGPISFSGGPLTYSVVPASTSADEGPGFDPNGRTYSLHVTTDEGNGIDPHG